MIIHGCDGRDMKSRIEWHRVLRVLLPPAIACNGFMMAAGTWVLINTRETFVDSLVDAVLVATIAMNMLLAVIGHVFLNHRRNKKASRIQWLFSAYLVGLGLAILGNTVVTVMNVLGFDPGTGEHATAIAISIGLNLLVHAFPVLACARLFKVTRTTITTVHDESDVIFAMVPVHDDPSWEFKPSIKKVMKTLGVACLILIIVISMLVPVIFLSGGKDWPSFIAGDLATMMLILIGPATLMLLRHVPRTRERINRAIIVSIIVVGGVLATMNAIPLAQTQITIASLDAQFDAAFGPSWRFASQDTPFHPPRPMKVLASQFFYTLPLDQVEQQLDIPYMNDKGQTLKFDWYGPAGISGTPELLPLVVAIHGGSWKQYDKGIYNTLPTSKYIASLGYIVVDVQYGLHDASAPLPFTIKDMIMEIANLTRFLAANEASFHANVSRTTFLGRSAGAHLALVCGLGHDDPYFAGNYSINFNSVGIIPFYPPTNLTRWFDNSSTNFFGVPASQFMYFNPVDLVSPTSPRVLCFQGLADTLVPPAQARQLQSRMASLARTCILGEFPSHGHAFDIFYNYPPNQACLYYIERFLAMVNTS